MNKGSIWNNSCCSTTGQVGYMYMNIEIASTERKNIEIMFVTFYLPKLLKILTLLVGIYCCLMPIMTI